MVANRNFRPAPWAVLFGFLCAANTIFPLPVAYAAEPERTWTVYIAQDKHLDYNWCGTTTEIELRMVKLLDYYVDQAARRAGRWNLDGTLWADVYRRHRGEEGLAKLHQVIRDGGMGFAGNHSVLLWGILDTETAIRACYGGAAIERAANQPARTALVMENPGMTWGVANILSECGFDFLGRGIYWLRAETYAHDREPYPLFWWKAPNGKRLLVHWDRYDSTRSWGGYAEAFRLAELAGMRPRAQSLQDVEDEKSPHVFEQQKEFIAKTVARYEAYGDTYPISSILLLGTGHDGWIRTEHISRFIERFNAQSNGRIRLVDARYQDFFEAAAAEIEQNERTVPTCAGSFGICWEEWAAHLAGLTIRFREAQRVLRMAEAHHALKVTDSGEDRNVGTSTPGFVRGKQAEDIRLINHGVERLLAFAEHDMGGIDRRLAAISAGVRADAVTQALDIGRSLAPPGFEANSTSHDHFESENTTFSWNGGQIVFDRQRCAIGSLVDADARELVPQESGLAFGEFIHTRYSTRAQNDSVFPEPFESPCDISVRRIDCRRGPRGVDVCAEFERSGFTVASTWHFHRERPWIDVAYRLQNGWTDDPQTVQFAFPLAMERPIYRYDTPGAVLKAGPKARGGDDLPGANPQLFAGLSFASASTPKQSVFVLTPDTLLLEFGPGAVRAPGYNPDTIPAQITSMPMMNLTKNDWQFGQAGQREWTFRYRVVLSPGPWDPVQPFRAAQQFGTPPFLQVPDIAPAVPGLAALDIDFDGGPVLAVKVAEDRKGLIVRVWNVRGERCAGSLKMPRDWTRAEACDALERPKRRLAIRQGRARFSVGPGAIRTIGLGRE